mmetsp:Transcript_22662/g.49195  ORF Transcript_22662/g.49195 Transcript_22662/m.49195 type:complete len:178 (-) Transcript_22662:276-809(-)
MTTATDQVMATINPNAHRSYQSLASARASSLERCIRSADQLLLRKVAPSTAALPGPNAQFDTMTAPPRQPLSRSALFEAVTRPSPSSRKLEREAKTTEISSDIKTGEIVANIKYKNQSGREAVLATCSEVHHDFGALASVINATIPLKDFDTLSSHPDIAWVDRDGAVHFVQPWKWY